MGSHTNDLSGNVLNVHSRLWHSEHLKTHCAPNGSMAMEGNAIITSAIERMLAKTQGRIIGAKFVVSPL